MAVALEVPTDVALSLDAGWAAFPEARRRSLRCSSKLLGILALFLDLRRLGLASCLAVLLSGCPAPILARFLETTSEPMNSATCPHLIRHDLGMPLRRTLLQLAAVVIEAS